MLHVRVTQEDHERILQAAAVSGLTRSEWMRRAMIEAAQGGDSSFLGIRASELVRQVKPSDLIREASTYDRWRDIQDHFVTPTNDELAALIALFPEKKQWLLTGKD